MVRVPPGPQELALSIENVSHEMTERLGRSPRVEELAQCLNRDIEDIREALQASNAHYGASNSPARPPPPRTLTHEE